MHQYKGRLILHTGSMFSGKTSSLEREIKRFRIAGYKTQVFKPSIDIRSDINFIKSHDDQHLEAKSVNDIHEIREYVKKDPCQVIAIDEVQFLGGSLDEILKNFNEFLDQGLTLICAGLDMDFEAKPFEIVKEIMVRADYVEKHHAVCAKCGVDAWISHRTSCEEQRVVIGATEKYEPLCRVCYNKSMKKE